MTANIALNITFKLNEPKIKPYIVEPLAVARAVLIDALLPKSAC